MAIGAGGGAIIGASVAGALNDGSGEWAGLAFTVGLVGAGVCALAGLIGSTGRKKEVIYEK